MKSSLKNISSTKVIMTVTLDSKDLSEAEQVSIVRLGRDLKVAGFRKGKAPASVVAKNVDPAKLQEETINNGISKAVSDAFLTSEVRVLDRPEVEVIKFVPGEMLEFTAEAEILPEVKLGNYKKLKVAKAKITVETKDIDEIIERMRSGLSEKKEVKRAAKNGDETTIDFVGKKDGVAFDGGTGTDYALVLGSNQFIPGFEEGIVGHKTGEIFDLDLKFPDDYGVADLKGAKVVFTTTIKAVKEVVLPKVDDDFAAKAGPFKTVDELTADIKRELTAQKERENAEKIKDDLVTQLVAASDVPVPDILVADQAKSIEKDFVNNLMYQGVTLEQYLENKGFESKEKWLATEVNDVAVKRVKAGLALAEMSKLEKIEATHDELAAQIEKFKSQYGKNPEALKQFDNPEVQRDIANRLLTDKTVDLLVELNINK